MTSRERKALLTLLNRPIIQIDDETFMVTGKKKRNGKRDPMYHVTKNDDGYFECPCEGFDTQATCKHVDALLLFLKDGKPPESGYGTYTEDRRPYYPQDNVRMKVTRAVTMQALPFMVRALARSEFPIKRDPVAPPGRPYTELSDVIVGLAFRTINNCSGAHAQSQVRDYFKRRLLYHRPVLYPQPPSEAALTANLAHNRVLDALLRLIEATNEPLKGSDDVIALDGSEFNIHTRHFRHTKRSGVPSPPGDAAKSVSTTEGDDDPNLNDKAVKAITKHAGADNVTPDVAEKLLRQLAMKTVKLHAAVSVKTGMVVAAKVTYGKSGEAPEAIPLIETARRTRFVRGIIADRGYPSSDLYAYAHTNNIEIAVPPRKNFSSIDQPDDSEKETIMREYVRKWATRTEEDKNFYGMRQRVEGTFARIKGLTSENLRSKTFEGQRAELLFQVLIVNLMVLIREYVFGNVAIDWLDDRCRKILDEAREAVADHPKPDLKPRFRDGLDESGNAA